MSACSKGPVPVRIIRAMDARDQNHDRLSGHYIGTGRNAHHRQLRSRGGENRIENLITLSGSGTTGYHGWVHSHVAEAERLGFIVHSWHEPADVPIYLADVHGRKAWHLLTPDGDAEPIGYERAERIMHDLGIWTTIADSPAHRKEH